MVADGSLFFSHMAQGMLPMPQQMMNTCVHISMFNWIREVLKINKRGYKFERNWGK